MGSVPWPSPRPRRWVPVAAALVLGAGAGVALWLAWPRRVSQDVPAAVAAPRPAVPAAAATALPPPLILPPARANEPAPAARAGTAATPAQGAATPAPGAETAPGLQLQAISQSEGQPVAVLSNRVVHEGDHFDGITVVRIGADEVEIEVDGKRRMLRF